MGVSTAGSMVKDRASMHGILSDCKTREIGLIYGAFFGFRALHDPRRYTRYGQVKDDAERSLRYWHCDDRALRFVRYCVYKAHKPGQFINKKGGISAGSTQEEHGAEDRKALQCMLEEFAAPYARLAKPGENTSCGIVWLSQKPGSKVKRASELKR